MAKDSAVSPPVTAVLDTAGAWLPSGMAAVEERLAEATRGFGPRLEGESIETLNAGGKRLRPLLVLISAGEHGAERAAVPAAAVELVHMATLVHDDVLDEAALRRGRSTVVARSGRLAATTTGDYLFSRAFEMLAGGPGMEAVDLLTRASIALARGELAQRADEFDLGIGEERYLERCRMKTAALFEAACLLGLNASGENPGSELWRQMGAFGREVGLAFQLLDDVLDISGPPERTGKARGTDLLDGTVTLPVIKAREAARRGDVEGAAAERLIDLDLRSLDASGAEEVCDLIAASGSLEAVRARALGMVEAARARLTDDCFDSAQRGLLETVAGGVVERYA